MQITLGTESHFLQLADTDRLESLRRSSDGALDYLSATLRLGRLSAGTRVSLVHGVDASLTSLFDDVAESWRGWKGAKSWSAYEGGLELSCTHDGLGHVTLAVELHEGSGGFGWLVRGEVPLEAGQLDTVARDVRRFDAG